MNIENDIRNIVRRGTTTYDLPKELIKMGYEPEEIASTTIALYKTNILTTTNKRIKSGWKLKYNG